MSGDFFSVSGEFIAERFKVKIPVTVWSDIHVPDHLSMRVVIDSEGEIAASGRGKQILIEAPVPGEDSDFFTKARKKHEKDEVTSWGF